MSRTKFNIHNLKFSLCNEEFVFEMVLHTFLLSSISMCFLYNIFCGKASIHYPNEISKFICIQNRKNVSEPDIDILYHRCKYNIKYTFVTCF